MKNLLLKLILIGLTSTTANAEYVRIWRGFALDSLEHEEFVHGLNHALFPATAALTHTQAKLRAYLPVVVGGEDQFVQLPDEVALLSYESEEAYRNYRSTPAGKHYGALHGDFFTRGASHSLVPKKYIGELQPNNAYEIVSSNSSWQNHETYFRVIAHSEKTQSEFIKKLKQHAEQVQNQNPIRYYLLVDEEYALEYIQISKDANIGNMPQDDVIISDKLGRKNKIQVSGGVNFPIEKTTASESSRNVWQNHINSWNKRDLNSIMNDYTENSVLVFKDYIYRGKKEIRQAYERLFARFGNAENTGIDRVIFENDFVYITWFAKVEGINEKGTDTYMIKDGKIISQTITNIKLTLE